MPSEREFEVVLYPDPVLRRETRPVEAFDEELAAIVDGMFARMFASKGVGLAAPQVGLSMRVFVLNDEGDPEQPERNLVLVNPVITARRGKKVKHEEGCLSLPGVYAEIERTERCSVEAFDAAGNPIQKEFDGFVARIIQHEYDHLEGVLLVDRMTPADKMRNRGAVEELRERYKAAQR